jgi:hypothetical protein
MMTDDTHDQPHESLDTNKLALDRLLDLAWSSSLSQIAAHLVTVAAIAEGLSVTHLILLNNTLKL